MKLSSSSEVQKVPIFVTIIEDFPGGGSLDTTGLVEGADVLAGAIGKFDEATRKFSLLKLATVYEAASSSATSIKIKKGSHLAVGEYVGKSVGGAAFAISAIDDSNAAYDTITVGTTLGVALVAGDQLFKSSATGASAAALHVAPNGVLKYDVVAEANEGVSVIRRGTVYNRRIPSAAGADVKAALPHIIFSEQR